MFIIMHGWGLKIKNSVKAGETRRLLKKSDFPLAPRTEWR
jgi:hypothetical protein